MRCGIIGVFWRDSGNPEWIKPFTGEITLLEGSDFFGLITDCYGQARIEGKFGGTSLNFLKNYISGQLQGGSERPIAYTLNNLGRAGEEGFQEICGGFKGSWKILPRENEEPSADPCDVYQKNGSAVCVIFPLP